MRNLIFIISLFLILFLSCNKEALVETDPIVLVNEEPAKIQMVPFNGRFIQDICTDEFIPCSIEGISFPKYICLDGNASHLGDISDARVEVLSCGPGIDPGSLSGDTKGYFVSANGDSLKFYGVSTVFADGTGGGNHVISGGSGRFEFACGQFTVASYFDVDGVNHGYIQGQLCNIGLIREK